MDRRSWLWRRKSSEKSPGESESSASSQHSERYSDDQEPMRASPNNSSPNHAQSLDVSAKICDNETHEPNQKHDEINDTVRSLSEKLSAALLNISAKEDLVKQHSKVAEEAVSGWEKAEKELVVVKQQLEVTSQKNLALEDRISHLDGALKECVRQLRQSRDEHEKKANDALVKKAGEWESEKVELKNQLTLLKEQLEAAKAEPASTIIDDLKSKIEATEKENSILKANLIAVSEELKVQKLEREFSTQTAENASKQHLESIKKVAKLEAECRRLKAAARKTSLANNSKTLSSSVCAESLTDSQSDSGDRTLGMDNEPSCSDSWASALISELDQFKTEMTGARNITSSIDIDLMDDFLEMERLASLPEAGIQAGSKGSVSKTSPSKIDTELMNKKTAEFEARLLKVENDKAKVEMALAETRNHLEISRNQIIVAEGKLIKLQRELDAANESKRTAMSETLAVEEKRMAVESLLESAQLEIRNLQGKIKESELSSDLKSKIAVLEKTRETLESQLRSSYIQVEHLQEKVSVLEGKIEEERAHSAELTVKVETADSVRNEMRRKLLSADLEVRKLQEKVGSLDKRIEEERSQSTEFAAKLEVAEAARKSLQLELESARSGVGKLKEKVGLLEWQIDEEKASSAEFAAKFQNLENELSKKRREADDRQIPISTEDLKIKQEKELALAAGKLAECQKTIASLGQQLKSLATIDDIMLDAEELEPNGYSQDLDMGGYNLLNGKERG